VQGALAKRAEIDQEWVISKLQETCQAAVNDKQYQAANKSLELIGKHIGMWPDKPLIDARTVQPFEIHIVRVEADQVLQELRAKKRPNES